MFVKVDIVSAQKRKEFDEAVNSFIWEKGQEQQRWYLFYTINTYNLKELNEIVEEKFNFEKINAGYTTGLGYKKSNNEGLDYSIEYNRGNINFAINTSQKLYLTKNFLKAKVIYEYDLEKNNTYIYGNFGSGISIVDLDYDLDNKKNNKTKYSLGVEYGIGLKSELFDYSNILVEINQRNQRTKISVLDDNVNINLSGLQYKTGVEYNF